MSREMVNSGIPWIGEIPKDWTVCFIKQIMRNKSIKGYPNETVLSLYREYGVVPKDSRSDNHNVTSEDTSSYKFVEVGDFVINKMKAWQGSMAVSDYQGIISPAYYICRFTTDDVDRKYIHYLLRNDTYKAEYMRLSGGMRVGQWDLNIDDFLRIKMVLPSLSEQQKIASFLDRKCAEIDEMITLQEKIVEELKEYKQSIITEAVTKGLNSDVPMKDSGIEWIGEVPVHWGVNRGKFLFKILCGAPFDSDLFTDDERYMPLIRIRDIIRSRTETYYMGDYADEYVVSQGDILIGMDGDFNVAKWNGNKALLNQRVCKLTECQPQIHTDYIYYLLPLLLKRKNDLTYATTVKHLSAFDVLAFTYLIPPIEEQKIISCYLNNQCSKIDSLINIKLSKIDSLKDYKKSIIYEYVTGKKEVTQ